MKALALLSTMQSADIVLPTTDGLNPPTPHHRTHREQKALLQQLGFSSPSGSN